MRKCWKLEPTAGEGREGLRVCGQMSRSVREGRDGQRCGMCGCVDVGMDGKTGQRAIVTRTLNATPIHSITHVPLTSVLTL